MFSYKILYFFKSLDRRPTFILTTFIFKCFFLFVPGSLETSPGLKCKTVTSICLWGWFRVELNRLFFIFWIITCWNYPSDQNIVFCFECPAYFSFIAGALWLPRSLWSQVLLLCIGSLGQLSPVWVMPWQLGLVNARQWSVILCFAASPQPMCSVSL